jgi:hypothetical protein
MARYPLFRLSYASISTAGERGDGKEDPEIARILGECRRNNARREVGGVLHRRDGYYFQVLEGPEEAVKEIYERISQDPHHRDVRTLEARPIVKRCFPDWSMKYVHDVPRIEHVLQRHDLPRFDPYAFDTMVIRDLVDLLVDSPAPDQSPDQRYCDHLGWGERLWRMFRRS